MQAVKPKCKHSCSGNGDRRGGVVGSEAWGTLHLNISAAVVARLALDLAVVLLVLLVAAVRGRRGPVGGRLGPRPRRCGPPWDLPDDAREALEFEAASIPLPAGLARPVQRS